MAVFHPLPFFSLSTLSKKYLVIRTYRLNFLGFSKCTFTKWIKGLKGKLWIKDKARMSNEKNDRPYISLAPGRVLQYYI